MENRRWTEDGLRVFCTDKRWRNIGKFAVGANVEGGRNVLA